MNSELISKGSLQVLFACKDAIVKETGVEFGRTSGIVVEGMSQSQIKGHLSDLQNKGMIGLFNNGNHNNVFLSKDGCDELLASTTDSAVIEQITDIKNNI